MPGMGEFVAANTRSLLVNVCSKDFPIWHVLSATPPPPSLDKGALRKGRLGRLMFHSMQGIRGQTPGHCRAARSPKIWSPATPRCWCVGRPRADVRGGVWAAAHPARGCRAPHSLLAVWRQVVGCRLRLPRLVAVPATPSIDRYKSWLPRSRAFEERGNRSCLGRFRSRWRVLSPLRFSPPG